MAAITFLGGIRLSTVMAVWQPFALSLGASMPALGLLEGLGGRMGLATGLIQPLGGRLSDRVGRKPLMALASLVAALGFSCYVLAAVIGDWRLLIPGTILIGLATISIPAKDAMTAESVRNDQRGMAYSVIMFFVAVSGILASTLEGFVAERRGYAAVFLLCIAGEVLALLLVISFLRETFSRGRGPLRPGKLRRSWARLIIPPRELRGFYAAMVADAFVGGLGSAILFGLLSKTYHFTTSQLGIMSSAFFTSWALVQLPVGRLIDRYGCKRLIIISKLIDIVVIAGWLAFTSFKAFVLLYLLYGPIPPIWTPATLTLLMGSVPAEERAEARGRLSALTMLIRSPAPYIGGLLYERVGFRGPILANLVGAIAALLLIALLVREPAGGA
ncbi:MAG: MFS transporter [Ardenticatenia bacterium]|nr:MFS transporter [Ardenticatenia bacterium]